LYFCDLPIILHSVLAASTLSITTMFVCMIVALQTKKKERGT